MIQKIAPEPARNFGLSGIRGLVVVQVEENTPAAEAGMAPGDIIMEVEQVPVKDLGGNSTERSSPTKQEMPFSFWSTGRVPHFT